MHNNSKLYTHDMGRAQRAARNLGDVGHNVGRVVINAVVVAPRKLVNQIFNPDHHIHWIRSRHAQRVQQRQADGTPPTFAGKVAADAAELEGAQLAALDAYGKLYLQRDERPDLKDAALAAMNRLHTNGQINDEELAQFNGTKGRDKRTYFDAHSGEANRYFPLGKGDLCRAAIGQEWKDRSLDKSDGDHSASWS